MKILLDECVPQQLCKSFGNDNCYAAHSAGFGGKKNGELLKLAEEAGFDVLITVDRGLLYQQSLSGRKLSVVIFHTKSNKLADLLPYIGSCLEALSQIQPGQFVRIIQRND